LDAVRCFEERESGCRVAVSDRGIQEVERQIDTAIGQALGQMTLRELAATLDDPSGSAAKGTAEQTDPSLPAPVHGRAAAM